MNPDSHSEAKVQPLREKHRAETAQAIVAAAEAVFAEKGVREARVEEIAHKAGVAVGTLYNHFDDRESVLNGLLETRRKELAARLDRELESSEKQPFDVQLARFALAIFEHFESHRAFLTIMLECDQARFSTPSPAMLEIRTRVETLVRRGLGKKALRQGRSPLWGVMFMATVKGVLIHDLRNPGQLSLTERADTVVDFFLHGAGA